MKRWYDLSGVYRGRLVSHTINQFRDLADCIGVVPFLIGYLPNKLCRLYFKQGFYVIVGQDKLEDPYSFVIHAEIMLKEPFDKFYGIKRPSNDIRLTHLNNIAKTYAKALLKWDLEAKLQEAM